MPPRGPLQRVEGPFSIALPTAQLGSAPWEGGRSVSCLLLSPPWQSVGVGIPWPGV